MVEIEKIKDWGSVWIELFANKCKGVVPGGARGAKEPPDFGTSVWQLTLSQPGEADYAHQLILAPSDFHTFLRPWSA